jgi:hypothetical protein
MNYTEFLKSKVAIAQDEGVTIEAEDLSPHLKDHQRAMVEWMVRGGRRACFASFGLGKSVIQLEAVRATRAKVGGKGLLVIPLGVKQEFERDAARILQWEKPPKFIRRIEEADDPDGIYMTNYETIRDGKMDPAEFKVASLDEASVLRGFGGSKTFREFMRLFTGDGGPCNDDRADGKSVEYRYVATATPSPNEYIELLAYADFLGIMDVSQAKTRFFKRDSTKADKLTLHAHKEQEFWLWVSSWGLFVQKPSDLGYSDDGYTMPKMIVNWHLVGTDHSQAGYEKSGQAKLLRDSSVSIQDAAAEKRNSLPTRLAKAAELRAERPDDHVLIWHDLEDERRAISKQFPDSKSVYGSQDLDEREKLILGFSDGEYPVLSTKPRIAGSGCNFQRHCHWQIFMGIGFKFNDFIQAIHRCYRFLQDQDVTIDIIYTEAEDNVKRILQTKWKNHDHMCKKMTTIIKKYGLTEASYIDTLTRKLGVDRIEVTGENHRIVNNDTVDETARIESDSLGLIVTSIPFSTQYEYSPNYADFGHSAGNEEFFGQMDYLTPELYRALKPGRLCAVHVKDRIVPGGMTGLGFQTVYPFHARTMEHFTKHGFAYLGMKTIVTDVVRENNQTYRLGWTEQCKDGSKMGVGMPEYLLIFRKPQTWTDNAYADEPVVKSKADYTRSRWQIDAHGFARSSGNRHLTPKEIAELKHNEIFQFFKDKTLNEVYDFEYHVNLGEEIDGLGKLPVTFMLLQPQSWSSEVWTDIARMRTLNLFQSNMGKQMHLCPLQFDIVDRAIEQWSMPGEIVYDPFGGIMTVPYCAIKKGRRGWATELNAEYFTDGAAYCEMAEREMRTPTLFDLDEVGNKEKAEA